MNQLAALRAFFRVAESGSFTRAAQQLGQPMKRYGRPASSDGRKPSRGRREADVR